MFEITTEPGRKLVRMTIHGMLSVEQITGLYRQEHAAIEAMGCRLGEHVCIVDLTECPLQVQDSVAAFQRNVDSPAQARRLALVAGRALARMQVRRIIKRDRAAIFETMEEAEAWLFDPSLDKAA